jgi:hypothetical protein
MSPYDIYLNLGVRWEHEAGSPIRAGFSKNRRYFSEMRRHGVCDDLVVEVLLLLQGKAAMLGQWHETNDCTDLSATYIRRPGVLERMS